LDLDAPQQYDDRSTLGLRRFTQRVPLLRRPLARPSSMADFMQPDQPELVPALAPLFDAIQMHQKFVRSLLQRQSLAQP